MMDHIRVNKAFSSLRDAMPPEVRSKWDEEDRERARLAEAIRRACADCLSDLADAIRSPRISRADLESAQKHLMRALSVAAVLDPE